MADKKISFEFNFEVKEAMKGNADFNKGLKESVDIIKQYNEFANRLPKALQNNGEAVKGFLSALETAKKVQLSRYNELISKLSELETAESNADSKRKAYDARLGQKQAVNEYVKGLKEWDENLKKVLESQARLVQASTGTNVRTATQQAELQKQLDWIREENRRLKAQAVDLSPRILPDRETYMNAMVAESMRLAKQRNIGLMTQGVKDNPLAKLEAATILKQEELKTKELAAQIDKQQKLKQEVKAELLLREELKRKEEERNALAARAVRRRQEELKTMASDAKYVFSDMDKILERQAKATAKANAEKLKGYEKEEQVRALAVYKVKQEEQAQTKAHEKYMSQLVDESMQLAKNGKAAAAILGNKSMTAGITARPLARLVQAETKANDYALVEAALKATNARRLQLAEERERGLAIIASRAAQERVQIVIAEENRVEAARRATRARELAELQASIRSQHVARMQGFDRNLQEQNARMRYGIALEHAQHVNDENTLQGRLRVERVRWAERTRQLEQELATQIFNIRQRVNQGSLSSAQGAYAVERAQLQFANAVRTGNRALTEQERALASVTERHRNFFTRIAEVIGIYGLYHTAINLVKNALKSIPKAGLEQQTTEASLFGIFGTEQGVKNLEFIKKLANEAGQNLLTLEQSYRRYAPSAILAGASQDAVNKSFKDFAEVGTILHLPADKINALFLALDQMYAKGVTQSEEIKKQLGNVLPGAVEIGAKAMGKTPAAFMEAMKKNEVLAKDFVPKFAELYRKIFGGPDDAVFNLVKDRLLSNTARVYNNYIELSRSLFARTQETLNSLVKQAAGALETLSENLQGTLQVITLATEALFVRLGIVAVANIATITSKLTAFYSLLTGLSLSMTAFIGTIITLTGRMAGLGVEYNKATGFVVTYKNEQVGLVNFINTFAIEAVNSLTTSFKNLETAIKDLTSIKIGSFLDSILPNEQDFNEFSAFTKAIQQLGEQHGMRSPKTLEELYKANLAAVNSQSSFLNQVIVKAQEKDIDALIASFNGQSATKVSEAIAAGLLKTDDQITRALANTVDIPAPDMASGQEFTDINNFKGFKDIYRDLNRDITIQGKTTVGELQKLEIAYKNHSLSISDYYKQAVKIAHDSLMQELALVGKQNDLALKANDLAKQQELDDKAVMLGEAFEQKKAEFLQKEVEDTKALTDVITQINIKYYERIGLASELEKLQFKANEQEKLDLLLANAKGNKEAELAAQRLVQNNQYAKQLKVINEAEARLRNEQTISTLKEESIQRQVNLGLKTQLQGMMELITERKRYVKELEKQLILEEALGSSNPNDIARKLQLQQQINAIKYEGAGAARAMAMSALPSFYTDYQRQEVNLAQGQQAEQDRALDTANKDLANPYADRLAIWETYQKDKADIEAKYNAMSQANNLTLYSGMAGMASNTFSTIADAAAKAYGAQSTAARIAFALSKAAAIAEITMSTASLAIKLADAGAEMGGPAGIAMAAYGPIAAYAMGAVQIASVMATAVPQAHAGLTDVPSDQTFLLKQGERVLAPEQNKDLKRFLKDAPLMQSKQQQIAQASNAPVVVKPSIKVINVHYDDDWERFLAGSKGEEIVVNHIRRANA